MNLEEVKIAIINGEKIEWYSNVLCAWVLHRGFEVDVRKQYRRRIL